MEATFTVYIKEFTDSSKTSYISKIGKVSIDAKPETIERLIEALKTVEGLEVN